jgi:hypothetical protein
VAILKKILIIISISYIFRVEGFYETTNNEEQS